MAEYNGHRSWNAWNVALWINNDEGLYRLAVDCVKTSKNRKRAARKMMEYLKGETTPDGAKYNHLCVYEAMEGIE
jgi:hypothetical protein